MFKCGVCLKKFKPKAGNQKYCSYNCRNYVYSKPKCHYFICEYCGGRFRKEGYNHKCCNDCQHQRKYETRKIWAENNPEREKELKLKWYHEKGNITQKIYYIDNKEKIKNYKKEYAKKNREKMNRKSREWAKNNKDKVRETQRRYDKNNPKKAVAKVLKRIALKRGAKISDLTAEEWNQILKDYNYRCVYCFTDKDITQDHIIPLSKGGNHTKENIVPACRSCNSKKHNDSLIKFMISRL